MLQRSDVRWRREICMANAASPASARWLDHIAVKWKVRLPAQRLLIAQRAAITNARWVLLNAYRPAECRNVSGTRCSAR